jgi:hypothetical protein
MLTAPVSRTAFLGVVGRQVVVGGGIGAAENRQSPLAVSKRAIRHTVSKTAGMLFHFLTPPTRFKVEEEEDGGDARPHGGFGDGHVGRGQLLHKTAINKAVHGKTR